MYNLFSYCGPYFPIIHTMIPNTMTDLIRSTQARETKYIMLNVFTLLNMILALMYFVFNISNKGEASWSKKKKAVDAHMMHMRLVEEEQLLMKEMAGFLHFYVIVQQTLEKEISELEVP